MAEPLTAEQRVELRRLAEALIAARAEYHAAFVRGDDSQRQAARRVADARRDIAVQPDKIADALPAVLDAADRLDAALGMLRRLEWLGLYATDDTRNCPFCGNTKQFGHAADCKLAQMLKEATP